MSLACDMCKLPQKQLIIVWIETLMNEERAEFCEACVNDALNGRWNHINSDVYCVRIGARRYVIDSMRAA